MMERYTPQAKEALARALGCTAALIGHCEERNDKAGILAEAGVTDTAAVNRLCRQKTEGNNKVKSTRRGRKREKI